MLKSDERECLASALQSHIHELVGGIVLPGNELLDDLLEDNCLTEEECASVRKIPDDKDKVRVILCLIKGRDFEIIQRFIGHVRTHKEAIADSIELKFEQNKKEGKRGTKCVLCQLTSQVNLKYIADDLWKSGLINDGLYSMIAQTDKPAGVQAGLWNAVITSLNKYSVQSPVDVSRTLADALRNRHHYEHLAKRVEWVIYTNKKLVCICKIRHKHVKRRQYSSLISSVSTMSSVSDVEIDPNCDKRLSSQSIDPVNPQELVSMATKEDGKVCILKYVKNQNIAIIVSFQ